jgi:hypothetical protein
MFRSEEGILAAQRTAEERQKVWEQRASVGMLSIALQMHASLAEMKVKTLPFYQLRSTHF